MKQFFILLFLHVTIIGFSQEYSFNLLTKYSTKYKGGERESVVYSNEADQNYFLCLNKQYGKNYAYLTDLKNNIIYDFTFNEVKQNGDIFFTFNYLKSHELKQVEANQNITASFKTISRDSLYRIVEVTMFKNKKKTKIASVSELKIKDYNYNLFPLYRMSVMHALEYRTDIDLIESGVVVSGKSLNKIFFESKLEEFKHVNFKIEIPKQ